MTGERNGTTGGPADTLRRLRSWLVVLCVLVLLPVSAPAVWGGTVDSARTEVMERGSGYRAEVRRTAHGVPHVLASNLANAGFGQGWAYAEDRFCDLADQVVKVRGERSRWHGPGDDNEHLASDLGYRALGLRERAQDQLRGLPQEARAMLEGYAAGFNAYLDKTGRAGVPGWCAGEPWIGPVTVTDLLARQRDLAISASGAGLVTAIATARPPGSRAAALRVPPEDVRRAAGRVLDSGAGSGELASNGWALGAQRSGTGRGMLVANPHFPWQGEQKFWENHLTVPGHLNVYGASVGGLPGVQIGFNRHVAWTHTVAPGARLTGYSLKLVPGDPTSYEVGGRVERMTPKRITVKVRHADGSLRPSRHTLWSTRYGPALDLSALDPALGWTKERAITYRDANIDNDRLMEHWLALGKARDLDELKASHIKRGTPWLTTQAVDSGGQAWYGNAAATPHLSREAAAVWLTSPEGLLDGSDPGHAWRDVPGAAGPGLLPAGRWPSLRRADYVFNANNSHWIVNARKRLEGYSPLLGEERGPLSARARFNATLLADVSPAGPSGPDRRFDLDELVEAALSNRSGSAELLAGTVIDACQQAGPVRLPGDGRPSGKSGGERGVSLDKACDVLADWDRTFAVDSRGSVLWRETMSPILAAYPESLVDKGPLFTDGFDPADPVRTPGEPGAEPTLVRAALAQAVRNLERAGLPLDVALGEVQHTVKGKERISVPGAPDALGVTNVVEYSAAPGSSLEPVQPRGEPLPDSELTTKGYPVNTGTSFLFALEFTKRGPRARGLLTTGQSIDPDSPHFADQTRLFSQGRLRSLLFSERALAADPGLRTKTVSGRATAGSGQAERAREEGEGG